MPSGSSVGRCLQTGTPYEQTLLLLLLLPTAGPQSLGQMNTVRHAYSGGGTNLVRVRVRGDGTPDDSKVAYAEHPLYAFKSHHHHGALPE